MNKTMFALGFLYEGYDNNYPYASTLFLSEDRNKVIERMNELVEQDCREVNEEDYEDNEDYEEDAWDDCWNYELFERCEFGCTLRHRMRTDLYTKYFINEVEVI